MPLQATSASGILLSATLPDGRWMFGDEPRVSSCCSQAEQCQPGDLFAVLDEQHATSQCQVEVALDRGAVGLLSERPFPNPVPQYIVDDCRTAFGQLCHALAGNPSQALRTIGITGTYGKSTTQHLLASIFTAAGQAHSGLEASAIDKGGAVQVARWLAESRAQHCYAASLEASSQALARRQLSGVQLDAAIITNVRHGHADSHGSLRNYQTAKRRLLDHLKPSGFAVMNVDDVVSRSMVDQLDEAIVTIGIAQTADLTAQLLSRHPSEQTFLLDAGDESIVIRTQIIGDGHIYNCLAATAVALAMGVEPSVIVRGIESITEIPHRLQRVECGQPFGVFIDRAHTAPSLDNAVRTLRPVCNGNLHCVMGVDRRLAAVAQAQIGRTLERSVDRCVLTGPGFDSRLSLRTAHEVLDGFDRPAQAHLMPDRAQAICWTLAQANPGDIVLLAGGVDSTGPDDVPLNDDDVSRYWLQHVRQPNACPWLPA